MIVVIGLGYLRKLLGNVYTVASCLVFYLLLDTASVLVLVFVSVLVFVLVYIYVLVYISPSPQSPP